MSGSAQTLTAFAIVALAAIWLGWNALKKKSHSECGGGDCACPKPKDLTKKAQGVFSK